MKTKILNVIKQIKQIIYNYISTNWSFVAFFVLLSLETILIRNFTVGNTWDHKPFLIDVSLILIAGSLSYLLKPKNQFRYLLFWLIIVTVMCTINSIYYKFYLSFTSFSLLATLGQVNDVTDSLVEKFTFFDFIYVLAPITFIILHFRLKKAKYYQMVAKLEKGKKVFSKTLLIGGICGAISLVSLTTQDYSRLAKQWNREYIVERFGIIVYQSNDLIQSLTPKLSSLFGYDKAAKLFRDFYQEQSQLPATKKNKYTGIMENMNVVFVHMESVQSFLIGKKINGQALVPTVNQLINEGLFFSNFYPQPSVGTSSDTEFTLLTSLMPALSGTVFVSYYDRDYVSIPKLLKEKGYYTFSMHGNKADMWNRANAHKSLGYDKFYAKPEYDVTPENTVGLGISDKDFFLQSGTMLEEIETNNQNYMGTLITLSNHSPFADTAKGDSEIYNYYGKLDLTNTYSVTDEETKVKTTVTDEYLEGTKLGNYLISTHYADLALGDFINYVKNSSYYNNTVFVFYGDHDAKLARSEYEYYYNYNLQTGEVYEEGDPNYVNYDYFSHELNRSTPLIIWTKNEAVKKKLQATNKGINNNVMGMYDILPTLGNMMGFKSDYALGHDIFDIKSDNVVIFPNGNFITNKIYYSNSKNSYVPLNGRYYDKKNQVYRNKIEAKATPDNYYGGVEIDENYITTLKDYVEKRLDVSNAIIVHDLIRKEGTKTKVDETVK